MTYFVSGEFSHQDGTLPNNEATRRNVRANLNLSPSDRLDLAISTGFGNSQVLLPDNDNNAFGYLGVGLLGFPWGVPIKARDLVIGGEWETCPLAVEMQRALFNAGLPFHSLDELSADNCPKNPFFGERTFDDVSTLTNAQKIERFTGSATLHYRPLPFLSASGTVGYDQFSDQTGHLVPVDPDLPFGEFSRGLRSIGHFLNRHFTLDSHLIATLPLPGDFRSTTSVGGQFFRENFEATSSLGRFLPPGGRTVSRAVRTEGFESIGEVRTLGLFVQQQFAYRDRLFITPAMRFDESSSFGETMGRKTYPRVMASYVVSDDEWFARLVPSRLVQALRIRGAWGESGKQPGSFAGVQLLGSRRVSFRDDDVVGVSFPMPGNPDLRPETGREIEFGFEADLLGGRLGIDVTRFDQVTRDAILARPVAPSTGFSAPLITNIGEITNQGIELGLNAVAWNSPHLRWDWGINVSTSTGEITELEDPIIFGLGGDSQRHQQGYPFGSYFSITYSVDPDGTAVASDSAVFVGHPTPEMEGSISSSVSLLGRLTLHANLGFARGHKQFNSTQEFRCGFLAGGTYGGICGELFERGPNGQLTEMARIKAQASEDQQYAPWIEDASFARLRTVSARVELPRRWIQSFRASRADFTLAGENLLLFTNYTGLDPEISFAGGSQSTRAEFLTLPPAKRVVGRLSVTF